MNFIKATKKQGGTIWVNMAHILHVTEGPSGTLITFAVVGAHEGPDVLPASVLVVEKFSDIIG